MRVNLPSLHRVASLGSLPSKFRVNAERKEGIEITVCETVKEIGLHLLVYPHHVPETLTIEAIAEVVTVSAVTIGVSLLNPENRIKEKATFWNTKRFIQRVKDTAKYFASDGAMNLQTESPINAVSDTIRHTAQTVKPRKVKRYGKH